METTKTVAPEIQTVLEIFEGQGYGLEYAPLPNRPARVVTRYFGYKTEIEWLPKTGWRVLFGFGTSQELLDLWLDFTGIDVKGGRIIDCDNEDEAIDVFTVYLTEIDRLHSERGLSNTKQAGVSFTGTSFEGYGERDFMAAIVHAQKLGFTNYLPGVGTKLGFEFQVPSAGGRIDAVELNEDGKVTTVIECQSGIQHGAYLDDEHFAKAISRYPQAAEVKDTVTKVVVIAGGYTKAQLATFKQLPYEIVALVTTVEGGNVTLKEVAQ